MPITNVSFTFENGVKREEYGPTRKASATIVYGVDDNENGEAVLAHIAHVARHRVQDAIGAPQPPPMQATPAEAQAAGRADADIAPTHPPRTDEAPAQPGDPDHVSPPAEPAKRTRRTKAQIEADNAREAAHQDPNVAAEGLPLGEPSPTTSAGSPAPVDERVVTNEELTQACAQAAQRLGDPTQVKATVAKYADPPFVANILSAQRAAFLADLAALK